MCSYAAIPLTSLSGLCFDENVTVAYGTGQHMRIDFPFCQISTLVSKVIKTMSVGSIIVAFFITYWDSSMDYSLTVPEKV